MPTNGPHAAQLGYQLVIRALILEEIVKAINAHDYNFDATLGRDGKLHITYSESVSGSHWNRTNVNLTLKVDDA